MDADAELDATFGRQAGVALDHAVLHFDRAAHRVDHAAELDDRAVAGALDDAPVMHSDDGVDEIAAQAPQPRKDRSSSAPASRLYPTTSATRIAASFGSRSSRPSGGSVAQKSHRPNPSYSSGQKRSTLFELARIGARGPAFPPLPPVLRPTRKLVWGGNTKFN